MNLSRTLLLILVLGCCHALQTQEFRFGASYSGSNVRNTGEEQWVGKPGYQFGVDVVLSGVCFVQSGVHLLMRNLNYSAVGFSADSSPTGANVEFRYNERAQRVPLPLGRRLLEPSDDPAFNRYLLGGPTALFNLSADLDNDAFTVETQSAQRYSGFGGGVEIGFLYVEGGYDMVMSNVFKGDDFTTNPKVNNVTLCRRAPATGQLSFGTSTIETT